MYNKQCIKIFISIFSEFKSEHDLLLAWKLNFEIWETKLSLHSIFLFWSILWHGVKPRNFVSKRDQ